MKKDKLITIRIESDKLDAFKRWTDKREISLSSFLYDVIEACLDGRIDERIVASERLDDFRIDETIAKRLASVPTREEMTAAIEGIRSEYAGTVDQLSALEDAIGIITDRLDRTDRSITETRSVITGVSCLLPPASGTGEGDRLTALENRTETMMRTLLELQEAVSIARRGETSPMMKTPAGEGFDDSPSIDSAVGDFSESSPKKSRERSTRESPKSQERPTFTTDLSIEEIQAKLTTGEGLTHAEFIEWNRLKASPRTVADWPTKMRAGEVAPRAYPNLQNEWEYRRERWFPLDSDGQTAGQ